MSKVFVVDLGGQDRVLRYTRAERKDLEAKFGRAIGAVVSEEVFPLRQDISEYFTGKLASQVYFLWLGLRHLGRTITEAKVEEWIDEVVQRGGNVFSVIVPAVQAAMAAGLFGMRVEFDEDESGKAPGA